MSAHSKRPSYEELLAENLQLKNTIAAQDEINADLKAQLAELRRLIFGQKRERFIPDVESQLALGLDIEPSDATDEREQITYQRRKVNKPTPHARKALPAHLPRKEIIIEPEEDISGCKKIGEEVTEELEYEPASLYVNRYVRPKYAKANDEGVIIAPLPSRPIDKGIAGPGFLSHILISKYVDHLPLYRQRKQLQRSDIEIAESTLGGWVKASCELLTPLYEAQRGRIRSADYLQVDETPIKVLDKHKKGKSHRGYFWVYYDPLRREVLFEYHPGRGREGPREMLADFKGVLQTDGYQVYDDFQKSDLITLAGCMAHARRKFREAQANDRKRTQWMLTRLQELYAIERRAREENFTHHQRYQKRQNQALPLMNDIKAWLNKNWPQVRPKSKIGEAISYMLRQWPKLETYLSDGRLEIDNNLVENAIRPVALGRKNFLFAGSHDGARRAALIYSLVANAKLQDVEPFEYLRDILSRIPDHPHKQVADLLPTIWKTKLKN